MNKTEFCSSLAAAPDAAAEQRLIDDFLDTRGPGDELSFTVRDAAGRPLQLGDFSVADYAALDVVLECGAEPVRWKPRSEAAFMFLFRE